MTRVYNHYWSETTENETTENEITENETTENEITGMRLLRMNEITESRVRVLKVKTYNTDVLTQGLPSDVL